VNDELPDQQFDLCHSIYGDFKELRQKDAAPCPLGKSGTTTTYTDANLYHDTLTGLVLSTCAMKA
jgi:hypothetical protein